MEIFKFSDYRSYVVDRIESMSRRGRGEYLRIATALKMHTSSVSQIFSGRKNLTLEQGAALAEYFELTPIESDYFLNLVELERAGTERLKSIVERRLSSARKASAQLVNRVPSDKVLSTEEKTVFYSNWFYSAVRLASDIPELHTVEAIAEHFSLPRQLVIEVLSFLVESGLCTVNDGRFKMGPRQTHLGSGSPWVSKHHTNWRVKAIEKSLKLDVERELQVSAPMVLSWEDAEKIRNQLLEQTQSVFKTAVDSKSEVVYCFNVDWFRVD